MAEKQGNKIEKECYKTVLAFSISTRGFNAHQWQFAFFLGHAALAKCFITILSKPSINSIVFFFSIFFKDTFRTRFIKRLVSLMNFKRITN